MGLNNDQLFAPLIDSDSTLGANEDARQALLDKILDLYQQVHSEDKNILIKSRISKLKFERFSLADSWEKGDDYYLRFLHTLDLQQLEQVMAAITAPILQGLELKPQTMAAFQKILHDRPAPSTSTVIQDMFDTLGNFFADSLKRKEDELYNAENKLEHRRGRELEQRELALCGNPCADLFKNYIKCLPNDKNQQQRFTELVRDQLIKIDQLKKDKNISTLMLQQQLLALQQKLLIAASRLADGLESAGQIEKAAHIRNELKKAGFTPKPSRSIPKKSQTLSVWQNLENALRRSVEIIFKQALKNIPGFVYRNSLQKYPTQQAPTIPIAQNGLDSPNSTAQNLDDLSVRVARLLRDMENNNSASEVSPKSPSAQIQIPTSNKSMNFAYNSKPKSELAPTTIPHPSAGKKLKFSLNS